MEVKSKVESSAWLDSDHPNFERWERGRELSIERGKFVKSIIEKHIVCRNLRVLDLGSGEGGTSIVLSYENRVVSYDLNLIRLERQKSLSKNFFRINGDATELPFKENSFDLVILQDVIEHLSDLKNTIIEVNRILKPGCFIYLSTPNKYSVFNLISDPHWGFPFAAVMKRNSIRKYFLQNFRKNEINRNDIPELFSLAEIKRIFSEDFKIIIETKYSVEQLLSGNKGIIWSDFHLNLAGIMNKFKLNKYLLKISSDEIGFTNKYLNPTFYLILQKKY